MFADTTVLSIFTFRETKKKKNKPTVLWLHLVKRKINLLSAAPRSYGGTSYGVAMWLQCFLIYGTEAECRSVGVGVYVEEYGCGSTVRRGKHRQWFKKRWNCGSATIILYLLSDCFGGAHWMRRTHGPSHCRLLNAASLLRRLRCFRHCFAPFFTIHRWKILSLLSPPSSTTRYTSGWSI